MKKLSKEEAKKEIAGFFENINKKSPKEIKKIKKLAMSYNIQLKELRKKFCKKCYSSDLKVKGIKKEIKTVECKNCGNLMKWKIKN
jgi:RNase P subunit RPR2